MRGSPFGLPVSPRVPGPGIEEHAGNDQVDGDATALLPRQGSDPCPPVDAARMEVTPSTVQGDGEVGKAGSRGAGDETCDFREPIRANLEVRERAALAEGEDLLATRPDLGGIPQPGNRALPNRRANRRDLSPPKCSDRSPLPELP